jgi:hypothetical protein
VGHTLRSSGLLRVKVSQDRVFQFASKLMEVRRRVVYVAPTRRLRRGQVEDGRIDAMDCVGLCYPCFIVFFVLVPRGVLVFYYFAWAYK